VSGCRVPGSRDGSFRRAEGDTDWGRQRRVARTEDGQTRTWQVSVGASGEEGSAESSLGDAVAMGAADPLDYSWPLQHSRHTGPGNSDRTPVTGHPSPLGLRASVATTYTSRLL
jgi:hypothetical protein